MALNQPAPPCKVSCQVRLHEQLHSKHAYRWECLFFFVFFEVASYTSYAFSTRPDQHFSPPEAILYVRENPVLRPGFDQGGGGGPVMSGPGKVDRTSDEVHRATQS